MTWWNFSFVVTRLCLCTIRLLDLHRFIFKSLRHVIDPKLDVQQTSYCAYCSASAKRDRTSGDASSINTQTAVDYSWTYVQIIQSIDVRDQLAKEIPIY